MNNNSCHYLFNKKKHRVKTCVRLYPSIIMEEVWSLQCCFSTLKITIIRYGPTSVPAELRFGP